MRVPSAAEWLDVWERGQRLNATERTLLLLAAAEPDTPPAELAALPLGACNARLLELRAQTFGRALTIVTECPNCGTRLEAALDSDTLAPPQSQPSGAPQSFSADGYTLEYRVPTTADLLAAAPIADVSAARTALLERLVLQANGAPVAAHTLPAPVLDELTAHLAAADPFATIQLALMCANCGQAWNAALDVGSFFWNELEAWAQRTLRQVHTLASAYGWSEGEILALSPERRRSYLELVGG